MLPIELRLLIFSFVKFSSNDLTALCRVCNGFHHALVDSLYESITVDNSDVCNTLAKHPYLAQKVKYFIFTYPTIMVYDGPEVHLDNLALALKNMTCLSTLKLIHSQKHEYSSVLQYCDAKLHDSIRDLALTGMPVSSIHPGYEMFLPTSLPHLTEVSANSCFLKDLVPGRPVHTVSKANIYRAPYLSGIWDLISWLGTRDYEPLFEGIEEITLTGLVTQFSNTHSIYSRVVTDSRIAPSSGYWNVLVEKQCCSNASRRAKFKKAHVLELHDTLCRLEHVSCVAAGPDISTSFDFLPDCLPISHEDNRTRGHRAANDVREFMPIPVLCCESEENLCDKNNGFSFSLASPYHAWCVLVACFI
ncbi:hypothetical protein BDR04DRAFT_1229477 [Suillus decipiens]|nr:hypothetical protein BDR04DRAFT_1229477 [Suillus decipiens]